MVEILNHYIGRSITVSGMKDYIGEKAEDDKPIGRNGK